MSACSTSRRKKCSSFHGSEYLSWDEGWEFGSGPHTPLPRAMRGVLVLFGSMDKPLLRVANDIAYVHRRDS